MNLIVMLFFKMERVGILVINLAIKVRVALEDRNNVPRGYQRIVIILRFNRKNLIWLIK